MSIFGVKRLLKNCLFIVLNICVSCSFLQAGFVRELLDYGLEIADVSNPEARYALSTQETTRDISNIIKESYSRTKFFPKKVLPYEKKLWDLFEEYKDLERDLVRKLKDIFFVAATILDMGIRLAPKEEFIDLNIFSARTPIQAKEITFCENLKESPPSEHNYWKREGFYRAVTYVFYAILPDVPIKYSDPIFWSDCSQKDGQKSRLIGRRSPTPEKKLSFWDTIDGLGDVFLHLNLALLLFSSAVGK